MWGCFLLIDSAQFAVITKTVNMKGASGDISTLSGVTTNTSAVYCCCFWVSSLIMFSRVFRSSSVLISS